MSDTETNLYSLPDEVITVVFSYLSLRDRKNTRLVCKRFNTINATFSLAKNDVVVVADYFKLNEYIFPKGIYQHMRILMAGYWYNIDHKEFWVKYGADFKSIRLEYCENHELKALADILDLCPNLQQLYLYDGGPNHLFDCECEDLYDFNMSNILSLTLDNILCPSMFIRFLPSAQKVAALSLLSENTSTVIDDVLMFLTRQGRILKKLTLSGYISEEELMQILSMCPLITELCLKNGAELTDVIADFISENLNNLNVFAVKLSDEEDEDGPLINQPSLNKILEKSTQLTEIVLNTKLVDDQTAAILGSLPNLSSLSLSKSSLSEKGLEQLFGLKIYPKLKLLFLSQIDTLTDGALSLLLRNLPNLKTLGLTRCDSLAGSFLKNIHKKNLKFLKLFDCGLKVDEYIPDLNSSNLVYLEIYDRNMKDVQFLNPFRLKELKTIVVYSPENKTKGDNLKFVFDNCPLLEYVVCLHDCVFAIDTFIYSKACDRGLKIKDVRLWAAPHICVTEV